MNDKNKVKFVSNEVNEVQYNKTKTILILKTVITFILVLYLLFNFQILNLDIRYLMIIILFLIRYGSDYFISKILNNSRL
jgi:hypothetical protein